jgi:hypothetical protein
MNEVERAAWISAARGCAFGALAIFMGMAGLAFAPERSLRFGGIATLLMCAILLLKAYRAQRFSHRKTEVWVILDPARRPAPAIAQAVIGRARQAALLGLARLTAWIAAVLLAASLTVRLLLP